MGLLKSHVRNDMIKWTDIGGFHNIRKSINLLSDRQDRLGPVLTYRGKIKLDGTNAGVRIVPRSAAGPGFFAQSRGTDITVESDNMGFARWCADNQNYFLKLRDAAGKTIVVFGEWCGKGIQKRCSISGIDRKIFAVFAIEAHFPDEDGIGPRILVDPDLIRKHLPAHPDIYIVPWLKGYEDITVDFNSDESLHRAADIFNTVIAEIEACDPWVYNTFGVEGLGEGVVYYPLPEGALSGSVDRKLITDTMFKAKGDKHQVKKAKAAVQVDPEEVASIDAFVDAFVTENRLEQGVTAVCGGEYDRKFTGNFLKWFCGDVLKESKDELEASGLTWKQVSNEVQVAARNWYFDRADEI